MSVRWDITEKRYGLACFRSEKPLNPDGEGDNDEFVSQLAEARKRAKKILKAGNYKMVAIWEAQGYGWEWIEDHFAPKPKEKAEVKDKPKQKAKIEANAKPKSKFETKGKGRGLAKAK